MPGCASDKQRPRHASWNWRWERRLVQVQPLRLRHGSNGTDWSAYTSACRLWSCRVCNVYPSELAESDRSALLWIEKGAMGSWHSGSTWKAWAYSRGRSRSMTWWDDGFCGSEGVRSMHRSVSGCCSLQVVWSKLHHHHICFLVGWYLIGLSIYLSSSHSNLFFPSLDHHFPFISFVWG